MESGWKKAFDEMKKVADEDRRLAIAERNSLRKEIASVRSIAMLTAKPYLRIVAGEILLMAAIDSK